MSKKIDFDHKYIIKAGATPKLIKSASESNSTPKFELVFKLYVALFGELTLNVFSAILWGVGSLTIVFLLFYCLGLFFKTHRLYVKLVSILTGVLDGFKSIKTLSNPHEFWLHTIVIWLMYVLMTYISSLHLARWCWLCLFILLFTKFCIHTRDKARVVAPYRWWG